MACYCLHPTVSDYIHFLWKFVKISWTVNRPVARLLTPMDNTDTEESRQTRRIVTPIGFRMKESNDGPEEIIHISNRTIPVVGMSKKLGTCLILQLSSKHECHPQGYTNLSSYANSRGDNVCELNNTCK